MANRPELIHRYEASGGTAGEFEIDGRLAELEPRKECVVISWASGPECLDQVLGHAGRRARISFAISDKLFETRSTRRAARLLRGRRSDVTVFRVDEDETTIVFEVTERRPGELSVANDRRGRRSAARPRCQCDRWLATGYVLTARLRD